ncbi:hypothetical protein [Streptacidiphilus anmyonensis]|uniref:hypothetical protein n=1 Tax=Streptacidiphilus anmyonensis TaxID=405782 RepID=UPI000A8C9BAF|nr:hypothetical protein [Streptacidiphilus anmyonensis]
MPTPVVAITTDASDVYHAREDCRILQASQAASHTDDDGAPGLVLISLGQALVDRHPCPACLR